MKKFIAFFADCDVDIAYPYCIAAGTREEATTKAIVQYDGLNGQVFDHIVEVASWPDIPHEAKC